MNAGRNSAVRSTALAALLALGLAACTLPGAIPHVPAAPASPNPPAPPTPPTVRPAPDDSKRVCAYTYHRIDQLAAYSAQIGRDIDCAFVYNSAAPDWASWAQPWFIVHGDPNLNWAKWKRAVPGRRLIITQGLIPSGAPSDWRQRGASGEYDGHVETFGANLVAAGLGDSIIRLAPEANGTWNKDTIGDTPAEFAAWRAYWARTARTLRAVPGAQFRLDWTVNANFRPIPFDSYYPGDDVVDIIGIDVYDFWPWPNPPRNTMARWYGQYLQPAGMRDLVEYATRHHKSLSIPEWALSAPGHAGGIGDNPEFIDEIARIVRTHDVAYQSYFLWTTDVGMLLTDAPNSLATYRRHFGADGDSVG